AGNPQPSHTIRMHDEWHVSGDRLHPLGFLRRAIVRRRVLFEVGNVMAGPLALVLVPPDKLLALAPRLSVGTRGGAVVENAPVRRPSVAPAVTEIIFRL